MTRIPPSTQQLTPLLAQDLGLLSFVCTHDGNPIWIYSSSSRDRPLIDHAHVNGPKFSDNHIPTPTLDDAFFIPPCEYWRTHDELTNPVHLSLLNLTYHLSLEPDAWPQRCLVPQLQWGNTMSPISPPGFLPLSDIWVAVLHDLFLLPFPMSSLVATLHLFTDDGTTVFFLSKLSNNNQNPPFFHKKLYLENNFRFVVVAAFGRGGGGRAITYQGGKGCLR